MSHEYPSANLEQSLTNEVESVYSAITRAYNVVHSERLQRGGSGWAFGFHAPTEHKLYVNSEGMRAYLDLQLDDLHEIDGINISNTLLPDTVNCHKSAMIVGGIIEEQLSELWGVSRDSFSITTGNGLDEGYLADYRLQIELSDLLINPDKQRVIVCALKHTNLKKNPVN